MKNMNAVALCPWLPWNDPKSLQDITVEVPHLRPRDVLVRIMAISVNPIDIKRRHQLKGSTAPAILGYDAAGIVEAVGQNVTTLAVGDEVWYAGDISRPGTNAELHAVDERIVAHKPSSLSFGDAAALPLTAITAWESLFERFELTLESTGDLLVVAAAGGVGSAMIQMAKALTGVRVIGTASRDDSRKWALQLGADVVIDHHDLEAQAVQVSPNGIDYLFSAHSAGQIKAYAAIMRPFGKITAIDQPDNTDLVPLRQKSIAWHWEFMFTRALYEYDMIGQKVILARVADLIDHKVIKTTVARTISGINAENVREAHNAVQSGRMIGKIVITQ